MKNLKKVLALVLAVVMIMGTVAVASAKDYTDVKADSDYAVAIDVLSNLNILDGYEDGTFKPSKDEKTGTGYLTRAQAAKIVALVHNAATTGAIKGQDTVSALYANAQNPFVDCNDSWALPFINYCRITGLADGMTKTTYAPERRLTGVQWLKLMLTTLNFDTAKEGYTGTGWDVNVLNRANEIGLLEGLPEGWKAIDNISRGEAAQILFNALSKYLVEYGQLIKSYGSTADGTQAKPVKASFVSNEQVSATGMKLVEKMGIKIADSYDVYWRPVTTWTNKNTGATVATFFKNEVARFTTLTSYCDVLKAIGLSETSTKSATFENIFVNGYRNTAQLLPNPSGVYAHESNRGCQAKYVGGQGVLTQVFKMVDAAGNVSYRITEVVSFLGNVKSVAKTTHPNTTTVTFNKVFGRAGHETGTYFTTHRDVHAEQALVADLASTAFTTGDYALVAVSYKDKDNASADGSTGSAGLRAPFVVDATKATGTVATLNGAIGEQRSTPSQTRIDGTYVNDAWAFVEGYNKAHTITNSGTKFVFFYDVYGNVIGMIDNVDAKSYFVAENINKTYEAGGVYTINAKLVDFEKASSDVKLTKVTSLTGNLPVKGNTVVAASYNYDGATAVVDFSLDNAKTPNTYYYGLIYSYADGVLVREGQNTTPAGNYAHAKNSAELTADFGSYTYKYKLTEDTKFLVKKVNGDYETYTGYSALPALSATFMDYVEDANGYATLIYLGNAVYGDEAVTGYVTTFEQHDWADGYERVTVYVAGEATVVLVPKTMLNSSLSGKVAGVYTFKTAVSKSGTVEVTDIVGPDAGITTFSGTIKSFGKDVVTLNDNTASTLERTIGLKDVKIYDARGNALTVIDAETLEVLFNDAQGLVPTATLTLKVYSTGNANIDGIYVVG